MTYEDYFNQLVRNLDQKREEARNDLIKAKEKSQVVYDKKARPLQLQGGDEVYLLEGKAKGKLGDLYTGPYKIIELLDNENVKIQISPHENPV